MCEKCYKSILVQYYIANCVSWVSMLTLLDLRTRSRNGTHSFMWVTYCTHFIGSETETQRKVTCQLNQCGPRTRSVFPFAAGNLRMTELEIPCWASPIRGCAVLAPGMSLPKKLGGSSPGREELNTGRSPATVKWKEQGLYTSNCPLAPHQCPLLPTPGPELPESWGEKVVTKNKTTNIYWAFYIHFLSQHHQSLFYRWGNWNRLKDVEQPAPI